MAEVPVSLDKLNDIVSTVASELFEELVIDNNITESEFEQWANLCAKVVTFTVDRYMYHLNNAMDEASRFQV